MDKNFNYLPPTSSFFTASLVSSVTRISPHAKLKLPPGRVDRVVSFSRANRHGEFVHSRFEHEDAVTSTLPLLTHNEERTLSTHLDRRELIVRHILRTVGSTGRSQRACGRLPNAQAIAQAYAAVGCAVVLTVIEESTIKVQAIEESFVLSSVAPHRPALLTTILGRKGADDWPTLQQTITREHSESIEEVRPLGWAGRARPYIAPTVVIDSSATDTTAVVELSHWQNVHGEIVDEFVTYSPFDSRFPFPTAHPVPAVAQALTNSPDLIEPMVTHNRRGVGTGRGLRSTGKSARARRRQPTTPSSPMRHATKAAQKVKPAILVTLANVSHGAVPPSHAETITREHSESIEEVRPVGWPDRASPYIAPTALVLDSPAIDEVGNSKVFVVAVRPELAMWTPAVSTGTQRILGLPASTALPSAGRHPIFSNTQF